MINIGNIAERVLEEIVSKGIPQITALSAEETAIANQMVHLLNDICTSERYEIDHNFTLELVEDTDPHLTSEENIQNATFNHSSFTFNYMKKVVDFARPDIAFRKV